MSKRLDALLNISSKNDLDFLDVMIIFTKYKDKPYLNKNNLQRYNPVIEEKAIALTERYFDIKKAKEKRR